MKKLGWIIYNGNLSSGGKFLDFAEWIQRAAARKNSEAVIYKNNQLLSLLQTSGRSLLQDGGPGLPHQLPDYVFFADKDIYLARQLEAIGVRVFNSADAIANSDDKITSYQLLAARKLPVPKTLIAPKVFPRGSMDDQTIQTAVRQLGLPMILKEAFGSFGQQVYLVNTEDELQRKVHELRGKAFVFQEFMVSSYGKDIRLHVVGDEVSAAMKRRARDDFRANVTAGGITEAYTPTQAETDIAISAARAVGADIAGVDLLFGPDGEPIICEINSNAHIRNMYECTGINVADAIMNYILAVLKEDVHV
ncbi:ATP-grasp domain-containing protein [Lentibacillus sediminis]|uniref:ATP-grasp domain-containing protein n=1 Tax=Lentibacillus sediminis TaxID=1940529 RepID=UPI000C1C7249|nr:RimK family alpha-L-glutamate ligase [Lentibacillus sediminis]